MKFIGEVIRPRKQVLRLGMVIGIVVVFVLGSVSEGALALDKTSADYVPHAPDQQASGQSFLQQTSDYKVLWDISHGVYLYYEPSAYFQLLVQNLASHGFSVDTTAQGFLVEDPASYEVIVVCGASSDDTSYTAAEVSRISNFVQSGGGLLIMGDNLDCPNANIEPVASIFGVSLALSDVEPYDTYTGNLATHIIFENVGEIYMRAAGEISASTPSAEVAWQEGTGKGLVAVGTYGNGRVVTLGDFNIFAEEEYYYNVDNRQFSINTFQYLAVPEPATILLFSLGGLFLRRRR